MVKLPTKVKMAAPMHSGLFCSGIMVEMFIFQIWMVEIQGVKKIIIILTK